MHRLQKQSPLSAVIANETAHKNSSHWALLSPKKLPTKTAPTERCYHQRNCPQKQFLLSAVIAKETAHKKQFPLSAVIAKETAHKNSSHWALLSPKKLPTKKVPTEHWYRQRNCPQKQFPLSAVLAKEIAHKTIPTERCYRQINCPQK